MSTSRVESSSLPSFEAAASGIPAILSDMDALREIVLEASLYPSGVSRQLDRQLENFLEDSSLRQRFARAGWSQLRGRTWEAAASAHWQEFEVAVASRRSRDQHGR